MHTVFVEATGRTYAMRFNERTAVFAGDQIRLAQSMMRSTRTGFLFRYFTFGQCHGLNPIWSFGPVQRRQASEQPFFHPIAAQRPLKPKAEGNHGGTEGTEKGRERVFQSTKYSKSANTEKIKESNRSDNDNPIPPPDFLSGFPPCLRGSFPLLNVTAPPCLRGLSLLIYGYQSDRKDFTR